jgi:hypothetical protein
MTDTLTFKAFDEPRRTLQGCTLTVDKGGRYWLWSDQLEHNLCYKADSREDALIGAIHSLLHTIKLRDERIASLQRIADLAHQFAEAVNPSESCDL